MSRRPLIRTGIAGATFAAGMLVLAPGSASAAHCNDAGGPGNSDFAEHVRASNGPGGHDEGDHQGWSSCRLNARSGGR